MNCVCVCVCVLSFKEETSSVFCLTSEELTVRFNNHSLRVCVRHCHIIHTSLFSSSSQPRAHHAACLVLSLCVDRGLCSRAFCFSCFLCSIHSPTWSSALQGPPSFLLPRLLIHSLDSLLPSVLFAFLILIPDWGQNVQGPVVVFVFMP